MDFSLRKHWVFDLDGTLIDTFPFYLKTVREILGAYDSQLLDEEVAVCIGMPAEKFFLQKLGPDVLPEVLTRIRVRGEADAKKIKKFPGIEELLLILQARGTNMVIWTSRDLATAKLVLAYTGLESFFSLVISGSCVDQHKPDPEGLHKAAAHFGCDVEKCVVVGDHDFDMLGAKAASAYRIRANSHNLQAKETCEHASIVISDVQKLIELVSLKGPTNAG